MLAPTDPAADYRVRIFTPDARAAVRRPPDPRAPPTRGWRPGECRATDERGGAGVRGRAGDRARGERLAFAAPPLVRSGPVSEEDLDRVVARAAHRPGRGRRQSPGSTTAPAGSACCWSPRTRCSRSSRRGTSSTAWTSAWSGPRAGGDTAVRGARVLPRPRRDRGPGHRLPQRRPRPVAGRHRAALVVRRGAGHRARPGRAGPRVPRRGHGAGGRGRHGAGGRGRPCAGGDTVTRIVGEVDLGAVAGD